MSTPIGINGGILVGDEAVAYGTEAATKVAIHAISSSLGIRRNTRKSAAWLSSRAQRIEQGVASADGEIVAGFTRDDDTLGVLLSAFGAAATVGSEVTYSIGTAVPDADSLTVAVNHGAAPEYTYTGLVPSSGRIELSSDGAATITTAFSGMTGAKEATPTSITPPASSLLLMPSEFGTLTIIAAGTDDFDFNKLTVDWSIPVAYAGLSCVGAATVRRAYWSGPMVITGSIEMDFDDDDATDTNTVGLIDDYILNGNMGAIVLTDAGSTAWLALTGCEMTGDPPSLQGDNQTFTCNFDAESLAIVMDT